MGRPATTPVSSYGTEHSIFRIGGTLAGRFPLLPDAAEATAVEARWLPGLAPVLPVRVQVVLAHGRPALSYPFAWAVSEWLEGEDGSTATYDELDLARDLAAFLTALESADPTGAPTALPGQRARPPWPLSMPRSGEPSSDSVSA